MTTKSQQKTEKERQWQATLDAAAAERARADALDTGAKPCPGQTYLNRRTADFPVEWLIIDTDDQRARVIPVDDHPLVGSHDLELPTTALGGPMVTRCDRDTWLDADRFEPDLRTGMLEPSLLEQIHHKRQAIQTNQLEAKLLESVVDSDPQYHRWRDGTLRRALKALTAEPVAENSKLKPASSTLRPWRLSLIAASLIGAFSLGVWHNLNLGNKLEAERLRVAKLQEESLETSDRLQQEEALRRSTESEVGRLQSALDETLANLEGSVESRTRELRGQVTELRQRLGSALKTATVTNIRRLTIDHRFRTSRLPGETTGTRNLASLSLGTNPLIVLEVAVVDPEPYSSYEVCMAPDAGGDPVCFDGLMIQDGKWLRLSTPRDRLEADDYLVTIRGFGLGAPKDLRERYDVRIQP